MGINKGVIRELIGIQAQQEIIVNKDKNSVSNNVKIIWSTECEKKKKKNVESGTRGNEVEMQKLWSESKGLIIRQDNQRWGKGKDHQK